MSNLFSTILTVVRPAQSTFHSYLRFALVALFVFASYSVNAIAAYADSPDNPGEPAAHVVLYNNYVDIAYFNDVKNASIQTGTFAFGNDGNASLRWKVFVGSDYAGCAVASPRTWLTITPEWGMLAPGSAKKAVVAVDPSVLPIGTHTFTLCLDTNDGKNPMLTIPLTITVKGTQK